MALGFLISGCNLPGIPIELQQEQADAGTPTEPDADIVCEADSRTCLASAVRVCSADGTDFEIRPCGLNETCAGGRCLPFQNTCDRGEPFGLSASELVYSIKADFKAQTQSLVVNNCGQGVVLLDQVVARGPVRPDGTSVFRLTDETPRSIRLEQGQSTTLGVTYRPAPGLSQVTGQLDLGIVTEDYARVSIPLRASSICVAAAPQVDLGLIESDAESPTVWTQNCGTEPVTVTEISAPTLDLTVLEKLPFELGPGQHLGATIAINQIGEIRDRVTFSFDGVPSVSTTVVGSVVVPNVCTFDVSPDDLQVGTDESALIVDDSLTVTATVNAARIVPLSVEDDVTPVFLPTQRPTNAKEPISVLPVAAVFRPEVVGTTFIEHRVISTTGERSCDAREARITAIPQSGLWVELTWENIGDLIPNDSGFGRGVNLNLHVLADASESEFYGPNDCNPDSDGFCAEQRGRVIRRSLTGERPEIVRFEDPMGEFDIGVYVSNPFNFSGAQATVRVFLDGALIDARTRLLTYANDFWWVGRLTDGEWSAFDSVFDGFPR